MKKQRKDGLLPPGEGGPTASGLARRMRESMRSLTRPFGPPSPGGRGPWPLLFVAIVCLVAVSLLIPASTLSHETTSTTVLFDREIVRILDQHCVMCHSDKSLSFPLMTYEQTWLRGRPIRAEVLKRHMPPWPAVPGYEQFANDNSLTLRELQFMVSWVEGLGPRNAGAVFLNVLDPNAKPREEVKAHVHGGTWQLGQPGLTRQLSASRIEAGQSDHVRRVVIDPGLRAERLLRAIEYMPGDARVVRAAFFTVQETGQWLGSWTPWCGNTLLPSNASYRLPAGAHIVAEIHYRAAKETVTEQGTLGLFFADRPTANSVSNLILEAKGDVPAGATAQRFRSQTRLTTSLSALALRPEAAAGVTSIEVSARKLDGGTDVLLFAKDISPDWPTPYIFKSPVRLAAGTTLSVTAYYSNSSSAPLPGGVRLTVSRY